MNPVTAHTSPGQTPHAPLTDAAALELQAVLSQREGVAPTRDRLVTTLFLVALLHVIVITGVTFITPIGPSNKSAPTLEVLMLTDNSPSREANPDAVYLAQRSQVGNGNTRKRERAANPADSPLAAINDGTSDGNSLEFAQALSGGSTVEVVARRADQSPLAYQNGIEQPRANETPLALTPTPPNPISTSLIDDTLKLRGKDTREAVITPDTRESRLAPYLDAWKRKIERVGTLNYPLAARSVIKQRNPVVEVVIKANGALASAMIQASSGDPAMDQAALNILRRAAPFDPFPANLKRDYDQLRFAYEWQFLSN